VVFDDTLVIETDRVDTRYFMRVKGSTEESKVDPALFSRVEFGACVVGEEATRTFEVENFGSFPLSFTLSTLPILTAEPIAGSVPGLSKQVFTLKWTPTSNCGLNTVAQLDTNLGTYVIAVTGVGAYPSIRVSHAVLDFGVCGMFQAPYVRVIAIANDGEVAVPWSIPSLSPAFSAQPDSGWL